MFRICIPTAGLGSRLGEATKYINKALVSVSNRPAITHIIELLPDQVEIVVPLGYRGGLVQEYLEFAHPDRVFIFKEITPFSGIGSGLGTTLLQVRHLLGMPFVFSACDAITNDSLPPPDHNWIGYGEKLDTNNYRSICIDNGRVVDILEKAVDSERRSFPYCGIAGIKDFEVFWTEMGNGGEIAVEQGESYGLKSLINLGLSPRKLEWFDTGTTDDLENTRRSLASKGPEPNVLEKSNEAIWFIGEKVIKYSNDGEFINKRFLRASRLSGFVPDIQSTAEHMYSYKLAKGQVVSSVINAELFNQLLIFSEEFWGLNKPEYEPTSDFKKVCMGFYKDKTLQRIKQFRENSSLIDVAQSINGRKSDPIEQLMELVDWDWLASGIPVRFHGDYHFENILYDNETHRFILVDWRQDFGGSLDEGDLYYDIAKLLHGLIVSHGAVVENKYDIQWSNEQILFELDREEVLRECESLLLIWLAKKKLDTKKVYVLTSLIFLNIAPLHHVPYSHFLYALGKSMLQNELKS
jgi:hypothetical protein